MSIAKQLGIVALALAVVGSIGFIDLSAQDEKPKPINVKCPLTGKDVNPEKVCVIEVGLC